VKIPVEILDKPGKLTAQEFEVIKTHTKLGATILSSIQGNLGEKARQIALYHHEHYSGGGYWSKYADELPVYIPMVSIADGFVALLSDRVCKHAWPPNEAIDCIIGQAGTQFNPMLVKTFVSLIRNDNRVSAIFIEGS
jgi:putative two-component system response regulator